MHFIHDLETDKIHAFTGGKAAWLTLPEATRKEIGRYCLFSKSRECWMSKASSSGAWYVKKLLKEAGFEDRGKEGERLSLPERIERTQEQAEARAERFEERAEKAEASADGHFKTFHNMMDAIPFGQPILIGHYSEQRDRNYRNRACGHMEKGSTELDKAKHYEGRAAVARATAEGEKYSNPTYLGNRIRQCETEIRELERRLEGKVYVYSDSKPISDEYRERLTEAVDRQREELEFYQHLLATCGRVVYSKETLKGMKQVKIRGSWEDIIRLNTITVSVPNICYQTVESQRKWPLKYPYTEVRDAR